MPGHLRYRPLSCLTTPPTTPPQFTPSAGPVNGGTILTIEGLNIGADRGHLDHVRVGDVNCAIIEYIPGVM